MAKVVLTPALCGEYLRLFDSCRIRPERAAEVESIVRQLLDNQSRYEALAAALGIPWSFIAVIHNMESSRSFHKHLHNGDPLTARTVQLPPGRPKNGSPPFTWEQSAADALQLKRLGASTDWSLAGTLYQLERYNGFGYRLYHPHVLSPYLWGFSNQYSCGKYVADGTWSDSAATKQCGAAVLLRRMAERGLVEFADQPSPAESSGPLVPVYSMQKSGDPEQEQQVLALQLWLNGFPGVFVKVDGIPGQRTSEAYRRITGSYLPGDPRQGQRETA